MHDLISFINSLAETWARFVWNSTWQSAVVAMVLLAIVAAASRLPSPVRYAILIVALLKFAVPPFMSAPSGVFSRWTMANHASMSPAEPASRPGQIYRDLETSSAAFPNGAEMPAGTPAITTQSEIVEATSQKAKKDLATSPMAATDARSTNTRVTPRSLPTLNSCLMLLHCLGSGYFVCLLLQRCLQLQRTRNSGRQIQSQKIVSIFESTCKRYGFRQQPELLQSDSVESPISFGCLHPIVMLPQSMLDETEFAAVAIAHELAHLKRYDSWFNWMQNLLLMVWWFNPVYWLLNWQIRKVREDCCDDMVLAHRTIEAEEYLSSLLEIAKFSNRQRSQISLQLAFCMASHPLRERIKRMMNPRILRSRRLSWTSAFAVLGLCAICLPGLRQGIAGSPDDDKRDGVAAVDNSVNQSSDLPKPELNPVTKRRSSITFKVVDSRGKPIEGASIFANAGGTPPSAKRREIVNKTYHTDDQGIATIPIFDGCDLLRTWTSCRGYVTLFAPWDHLDQQDVPDLIRLEMQDATSLGGIVLDADGKPIEDVKVEVRREAGGKKLDKNENTRLNTWLSYGDDAVRTDKLGHWMIENAPAGNVELELQLTHPDYEAADQWQTMAHFGVTLEELRYKTAKFTLSRGLPIHGKVADSNGQPVADALVVWGDSPYGD